MDIVRNKEETLRLANTIATDVLKLISKSTAEKVIEEDPAEIFYLQFHILAIILSRAITFLEGYASIYNIDKMDQESIFDIVTSIAKEYLAIQK